MKYLILLTLITSCSYDVYEKNPYDARMQFLQERYDNLYGLMSRSSREFEANRRILNVINNKIEFRMNKQCKSKLGPKAEYKFCTCTTENNGVFKSYKIPECEDSITSALYI